MVKAKLKMKPTTNSRRAKNLKRGSNQNLKNLLDSIKKDLKPITPKKELNSVLKQINLQVKKNKEKAKAVFGGSIAKETNIKDDFDCDIFLKFTLAYKNKSISDIAEKILKKFSPERIHGSRDYFQFKIGKIKYEIVPVLDIKDIHDLENTTDASPLHVLWVRKQARKNPKIIEEIRLTKQFCKAQNIYGAESYIKGFSGHVVDIITIYYGGFVNLLEESQNWKKKQVIDFYNVYKGNALNALNSSKLDSPLIVIDPIQSERNASASLCDEKFEVFKKAAAAFLKEPSSSFFVKKNISIDEIKKLAKGHQLLFFEATSLAGKQDIVGTKLLKAFEYIKTKLCESDFSILVSDWTWDKATGKATFFIISDALEKEKTWQGPPLKNKLAVLSFKQKHAETFEKDGRIYAKVQRAFTLPKDLCANLLSHEQVKERVKTIKLT